MGFQRLLLWVHLEVGTLVDPAFVMLRALVLQDLQMCLSGSCQASFFMCSSVQYLVVVGLVGSASCKPIVVSSKILSPCPASSYAYSQVRAMSGSSRATSAVSDIPPRLSLDCHFNGIQLVSNVSESFCCLRQLLPGLSHRMPVRHLHAFQPSINSSVDESPSVVKNPCIIC